MKKPGPRGLACQTRPLAFGSLPNSPGEWRSLLGSLRPRQPILLKSPESPGITFPSLHFPSVVPLP